MYTLTAPIIRINSYCNRTIKSRWLVNISSWTYCYSNCCWFNDAIVTNHHYLYVSIKQRGTAMGLSGLAVGLAPAMGPTFAGWILNKTTRY